MARKPKRFRVALLIEPGRAYGRGLLYGVARYTRTHGPWSIYHHERRLGDEAPDWLKGFDGDGVIARIENRKLINALSKLGLPTVDVNARHRIEGVPSIDTDNRRVVELALEHLFGHGLTEIAFCGYGGLWYSDERLGHLRDRLTELGREPHVYTSPTGRADESVTIAEARGLGDEVEVIDWLRGLPKPVGVVACNDIRGRQVLNACRAAGIAVPDEVAVVGVDNDELLCELADPPLSSVEPHTERIGYDASALLDRMMRGRKVSDGLRRVEPRGVIARRSTDTLAMADADMIAAVRFMHDHACEPITIDDVLEHVSISRSTLERRFMKLLGRSPKDEIIRLRTERVKRLLAETDYTLPQIARLTGFKHHGHLSVQFKRKVGQTPGEYRKQMGG